MSTAIEKFSTFTHQHWRHLKEQSKTEGLIYKSTLELATDMRGDPWVIEFMDERWRKINLKYVKDGWVDGQLDFIPNVKHIQRYGRLLF